MGLYYSGGYDWPYDERTADEAGTSTSRCSDRCDKLCERFFLFATRARRCDVSRIFAGAIRISQPLANCGSGRRDGCPVPPESAANQLIPVGFRAGDAIGITIPVPEGVLSSAAPGRT